MTVFQLGIVGAAAVAAILIVVVLDRRRRGSSVARPYGIPRYLALDDFPGIQETPAIVLFSHPDCRSCNAARRIAGSQAIPLVEIDGRANERLLEEYGIDGVPATLIINGDGSVAKGWVGPLRPHDVSESVSAVLGRSPS